MLKENMSIADLVQRATSLSADDVAVKRLMNLIMQFRKVCNHPELFERADVTAPLSMVSFNPSINLTREGPRLELPYGTSSQIVVQLPKLITSDGGLMNVPGPDSQTGSDSLYLDRLLNIWQPDWINAYLKSASKRCNHGSKVA